MAKTVSGTYLSLKCFIPHGETLQEQIETLQALQSAANTGEYGHLLGKARLIEARTDQRRMRFDDEQPVPFEPDAVRTPEGWVTDEPAAPRRKRG